MVAEVEEADGLRTGNPRFASCEAVDGASKSNTYFASMVRAPNKSARVKGSIRWSIRIPEGIQKRPDPTYAYAGEWQGDDCGALTSRSEVQESLGGSKRFPSRLK